MTHPTLPEQALYAFIVLFGTVFALLMVYEFVWRPIANEIRWAREERERQVLIDSWRQTPLARRPNLSRQSEYLYPLTDLDGEG